MAPSPANGSSPGIESTTWDPPVPAIQAYNWRGRKACEDWRGKMDDMLQPADWQQSIFLHSRGHTGISQVMFLQVVYLVAWMTGRPVVQFTEGPVWTILHSNYVHPRNQVCNFTRFQLWEPRHGRAIWSLDISTFLRNTLKNLAWYQHSPMCSGCSLGYSHGK